MIEKNEIRRLLTAAASHVSIEIREQVTSTNTVLKAMAEEGAGDGTVLIAQEQTAGKGRLGRSFSSPKGTGLYMSILLRPSGSAQASLSITTAAAVAVARAIEQVTGETAKIKWVNDIYVNIYKVCGILAESAINPTTAALSYVVLGIGVNICKPQGGFSPEIQEIAGALYRDLPPEGTTEQLTAAILNEFFNFYEELGAKAYLKEYQERSLLNGLTVTFVRGDERKAGTVLGIDDEARLAIQTAEGVQAFSMGEVAVEKDFLQQLRKV